MTERGTHRRGGGTATVVAARTRLAARLRERLPELRAAVATRVCSIADPREVADPGYPERLKAALEAAVEHRLAVLEAGGGRPPAMPPALLAQARLDARDGVPLDTVLRRYVAGTSLFSDFLAEEAEGAGASAATVRGLLAEQATEGDRLLAAVSAEHAEEAQSTPRGTAERRRETVKRLLAGELVDDAELSYDLGGHHLGLIVRGDGMEERLPAVAAALDRRLLAVRREEEPVWACWLGGHRPPVVAEAVEALVAAAPRGTRVTVGEPAAKLAGWRLTHLQAKAALAAADTGSGPVVRYADVAVVATIARDDLAAETLRRLYLEPLAQLRDGGAAARETLRAYFLAERNVSSTAAALGVDRRTVGNRLRAVEELLGRPLAEIAVDVEIALRLDGSAVSHLVH